MIFLLDKTGIRRLFTSTFGGATFSDNIATLVCDEYTVTLTPENAFEIVLQEAVAPTTPIVIASSTTPVSLNNSAIKVFTALDSVFKRKEALYS